MEVIQEGEVRDEQEEEIDDEMLQEGWVLEQGEIDDEMLLEVHD
jgi:hypothetical protein